MRVMRVGLVLVGLPLAACQSAADHRAAMDRADDAACRSYGLAFGTPAYAECRQRRDAIAVQGAVAALGTINAQRQIAPPPAPYVMQSPARTTCSGVGGATNCTTY